MASVNNIHIIYYDHKTEIIPILLRFEPFYEEVEQILIQLWIHLIYKIFKVKFEIKLLLKLNTIAITQISKKLILIEYFKYKQFT